MDSRGGTIMAITYSTYTSEAGFEFIVRTNEDESISYIPCDLANSDYQAYLNKDKPVEHFTPNV
jgi:hypothetical protein